MEPTLEFMKRHEVLMVWWYGPVANKRNDQDPDPPISRKSWWRHQMETFSALLAFCAGNSPVTGEFPPMTRSSDVFFDLRLNERLSKQSGGWWFETPSCSLWRNCNVFVFYTKHATLLAVIVVTSLGTFNASLHWRYLSVSDHIQKLHFR